MPDSLRSFTPANYSCIHFATTDTGWSRVLPSKMVVNVHRHESQDAGICVKMTIAEPSRTMPATYQRIPKVSGSTWVATLS